MSSKRHILLFLTLVLKLKLSTNCLTSKTNFSLFYILSLNEDNDAATSSMEHFLLNLEEFPSQRWLIFPGELQLLRKGTQQNSIFSREATDAEMGDVALPIVQAKLIKTLCYFITVSL